MKTWFKKNWFEVGLVGLTILGFAITGGDRVEIVPYALILVLLAAKGLLNWFGK